MMYISQLQLRSFSRIMVPFCKMDSKSHVDYQLVTEKADDIRECSDYDQSESDDLLGQKDQTASLLSRHWPCRWWWLLVFHFVLFCLYLGLLVVVYHEGLRVGAIRGPRIIYTPAHEAVVYAETTFVENSEEHGPFSGYPRPEVDKNWHDLINAENIWIEPEVMKYYGREEIGVAIPEGGGYIGTLNVYHELHCIKRLYQYNYPEYYWRNITEEQREINRLHNEHCLDFLRQSAMCHGDVGLITFQWAPTSLIPVANATRHECVNWTKIDEWTKARTVDMMKPGWLVHPMFGPAYPDGEGSKLGAFKTTKGGTQPNTTVGHGDH